MNEKQKTILTKSLWIIGLVALLWSLLLAPIHIDSAFTPGDFSQSYDEEGWRLVLPILSVLTYGIQSLSFYQVATLLGLLSVFFCANGRYRGQKRLPIVPLLAVACGVVFALLLCTGTLSSYSVQHFGEGSPVYSKTYSIVWSGYLLWMSTLVCLLVCALLQRGLQKEAQNTEGTPPKSLIDRMLRGPLTQSQRTYFCLFLFLLLPWFPMASFIGLIYDSAIHSQIDAMGRMGVVLTVVLYPLYLWPLFLTARKLSDRFQKRWIYYLLPLLPFVLFCGFFWCCGYGIEREKPEGCDEATLEFLDNDYSLDKNTVYYELEPLAGSDPASFHLIDDDYAADVNYVYFQGHLIPGADPKTIECPTEWDDKGFRLGRLAHDAFDYYYRSTPLHVADMSSFKRLGEWAIDRQQVYCLSVSRDTLRLQHHEPIGDYDTFEVMNLRFAKDKYNVYYYDSIVVGADPATVEMISGNAGLYIKDKDHIYYRNHIALDSLIEKLKLE